MHPIPVTGASGKAGLARIIGPEFASMSANFRSNLAQGRAAIVAVVAELA